MDPSREMNWRLFAKSSNLMTAIDFISFAFLCIFFFAACRLYRTAVFWEHLASCIYFVVTKLTVHVEWQEEVSKGQEEDLASDCPEILKNKEKENKESCVQNTNTLPNSCQSSFSSACLVSLSSNLSITKDSTSLCDNKLSDSKLWIESGSLFSEFSSVNKKASYCKSDDESDGFQSSSFGGIFDGAFSPKRFSPVIEPSNNSLFEEDERFQWVDAIWDEEKENNEPLQNGEKMLLFGEANENVPFSGFERHLLLSAGIESESRSRTATPEASILEQNSNEIQKLPTHTSNYSKDYLMAGIYVMINGGKYNGSFGYIENVNHGNCNVSLFISATGETAVKAIANEYLKPLVPNADMELTVKFVDPARVYFCPKFATTIDENDEYEWRGMKVWQVQNPMLKNAIPENSELVKVNGQDVQNIEFAKLQQNMDKLETPYTLTIKFPSVVQQIKMTDLFSEEASSGKPLSVRKKSKAHGSRRKGLSNKNSRVPKRRGRGRGKKFNSWKRKQ